jgi:hypothetical protein
LVGGTIVYNLEVHCQRMTQFKCGLYCVFRGEDFSDFKGEDFPNDLQFDVMDQF